MILPRGFPQSVSPGYEGYTGWLAALRVRVRLTLTLNLSLTLTRYTGWLAAGLFAHSFTVMVSTK